MDTIKELERKLEIAKRKATATEKINPRVPTGIVIDLTGPEGNIFCILRLCRELAKKHLNGSEIYKFDRETCTVNSEKILKVCRKWFGFTYITADDVK